MTEWLVPAVLVTVLVFGKARGVRVFDEFVEGAREGLKLTYKLLPYLVAMLSSVEMFKRSGALEAVGQMLFPALNKLGVPPEILPLMIIRPISGGAASAIVLNVLREKGPDSLVGRMASVMQGSSDTTFYVLSLYFGSVNVTKTRHALWICLIGDVVGFACAILLTHWFFG
ncbi:MAG: spore maturation protein [Bacillota bacterium]